VPQGQHVHVLLNSGRSIFERLFPGLADDLAHAGAPAADGINDLLWLNQAGWALRYPSKYRGRIASRPLLEFSVRRRLAQNPRVSFVDGLSARRWWRQTTETASSAFASDHGRQPAMAGLASRRSRRTSSSTRPAAARVPRAGSTTWASPSQSGRRSTPF
jgi:hypothetical protein